MAKVRITEGSPDLVVVVTDDKGNELDSWQTDKVTLRDDLSFRVEYCYERRAIISITSDREQLA